MRALIAVSLAGFVTALCCAMALPARATSVVPMTVEQIASASDVIVDGEVIIVESRFVGRRILTFATLRVDRVLHGSVAPTTQGAQTVTFAVLGGVVGGVGQKVPGAPAPQLGARYVAALSRADGPEGARSIIGFSQGLWRVDTAGRVLVVDGPVTTPPPRVPVDDLVARFGAARTGAP